MGARRSIWIWVGTGAFLLVLLAVWVFRASLTEQRKPRSAFGAKGFENSMQGTAGFPQTVDPNSPKNNPALDPHVQETLRTIDEINRINKFNLELRRKTPSPSDKATPVTPVIPQEKTPPSDNR